MEYKVYTDMNIDSVIDVINAIPLEISGAKPDREGLARDVKSRVAWTMFQHISQAFDDKSRGGADESGLRWKRNSPKYLAYQKGRARAMRMRSDMRPKTWENGGAGYRTNRRKHLNSTQFRLWKKVYNKNLAILNATGSRWSATRNKADAANAAWAAMRKAGADSLIKRYGTNNADQILVDTGILRRSLEPGNLASRIRGTYSEYKKPTADQIFTSRKGWFLIGTRAKTAAYHHFGTGNYYVGGRGAIRRRLWPLMSRWPSRWWDEACSQAADGIVNGLLDRLGG